MRPRALTRANVLGRGEEFTRRNRGRASSSRVPHEIRPALRGPVRVVLRIQSGLPDLTAPHTLRRLEEALEEVPSQRGFALVDHAVRRDELRLVVEVKNRRALARGMQGLGIRVAKGLNAAWKRKRGRVFAERYLAEALARRGNTARRATG